MKVVTKEDAQKERERIDYSAIADFYNRLQVGEALQIEAVYNITLFRKRIVKRGLKADVDFEAFGKNGKTLVKRLSTARMSKD